MKLSIIIPAYNAAQYIKKCIRSCEQQDISQEKYEVIVVDDGSTDNTKECILELQKEFFNIKYIYQDNARQGAARNNGLRNSKGKYIWYVDADDWIEDNCLGTIINKLEKESLTALIVGHVTKYDKKEYRWYNIDERTITSGKEILKGNNYFISPTYAVWEREYLVCNKLYFKENLFHEDSEFFPRLFYKAERIGALSKICYFVYPNMSSTTRGVNPKRAFDIITVVRLLNEYRLEITDREIDKKMIDYISMTLNSSLYNVFHLDKYDILNLDRQWYGNKDLFRILIKSTRLKYKIEGWLFTLFPYRISVVYKLMQLLNSDPGGMNEQKSLLNIK